jgi:cytochrome c peroxidase
MTHTRATCTAFAGSIVVMLLAAVVPSRTQAQFAALPAQPDAPADNPTTPEKIALGKLLFWDPILSGTKDVACATCHHPSFGYADGLDLAIGANGIGMGTARHFSADHPTRFVKRNSPTVLNAAFNGIDGTNTPSPSSAPMFWDSRVRSLEAQALEPLKALEEMRGDAGESLEAVDQAVARIAAIPEYRRMFVSAFGAKADVTATNLSRAIAAFERTLITTNAPYDRYMRGDTSAMTDQQLRGLDTFQRMGCANCHSGPMFSDYKTHVLGVSENAKLASADTGAENRYAFRTPSLRNLRYTAPYMHNGTLASLDDVLNFYNRVGGRGGRGGGRGGRFGPAGPGQPPPPAPGAQPAANFQGRGGFGRGGRGTPNPNVSRQDLDPLLQQVNVRGGRQDVIAFLDALNDPDFDKAIPAKVPSGLRVGGRTE